MQRDGRLARAALEIGDGGAKGALARRAFRQQGPLADADAAAQLVDLIEAEPTLAAVLLNFPEGKVWVRRQLAAEGGLVHAEDQLCHLPAGEAA